MKKLYLVKREVRANNIQEAIRGKGTVYEVQVADDKCQPQEVKQIEGFIKKKKR